MLILLYKFQKYSYVNATILLTTTTCKVVHICPCLLQKECDIRYSFLPSPSNYNATKCLQYLNRISNFVGLKLSKKDHPYMEKIHVTFLQRQYVTIQIFRNTICSPHNLLSTMHGGFYLQFEFFNFKSVHMLKASLHQHLFTSNSCKYVCGFVNTVDFCTHEGWNNHQRSHRKEQFVERRNINSTIFISKKCGVIIEEPLHANNWIDIILNQESSETNKNLGSSVFQKYTLAPSILKVHSEQYLLNFDSQSPFHAFALLLSANLSVAQLFPHLRFYLTIMGRRPSYQLTWESCSVKINKPKIISLPVWQQLEAVLFVDSETELFATVTSQLLTHLYAQYTHFQQNPLNCPLLAQSNFQRCYNFSADIFHTEYDFIIFEEDIQYTVCHDYGYEGGYIFTDSLKFQFKEDNLYSWQEAAAICSNITGQLPFFTSRHDLQTLIALIKLTSYLPPIEASFVGLKQNKVINLQICCKKLKSRHLTARSRVLWLCDHEW